MGGAGGFRWPSGVGARSIGCTRVVPTPLRARRSITPGSETETDAVFVCFRCTWLSRDVCAGGFFRSGAGWAAWGIRGIAFGRGVSCGVGVVCLGRDDVEDFGC